MNPSTVDGTARTISGHVIAAGDSCTGTAVRAVPKKVISQSAGDVRGGDSDGHQADGQHEPGGPGRDRTIVARRFLGRPEHSFLGEEAGERRQARQRGEADGHRGEGDRHRLAQPAHVRHQVCPDDVDHRAGGEEEQGLEGGVGQEVVGRRGRGTDREGGQHVGQLADGGVGQNSLDVVLRECGQCAAQHGDAGNDGHHRQGRRRGEEHRIEPGNEIDAGCDHRGCVDQRTDGRRSGHRVGQPGVQRELRRLAHDPAQQQQGGDRCRVLLSPPDGGVRMFVMRERSRRDGQREDAEQEADVTEAGDHERLDGAALRVRLLPVVADQEVGADTHHLPPDQQDEQVVGEDDQHHGGGEQRHEGGVRRIARVALVDSWTSRPAPPARRPRRRRTRCRRGHRGAERRRCRTHRCGPWRSARRHARSVGDGPRAEHRRADQCDCGTCDRNRHWCARPASCPGRNRRVRRRRAPGR